MSFFIPCDDANTQMYFSESVLNAYKDSALYTLHKLYKENATPSDTTTKINVYNGGILLHDVDKKTLKLIQECLLKDFDLNVILKYLKNENIQKIHFSGHLMYVKPSGTCLSYSAAVNCDLFHTNETNYLILTELNDMLKKYVNKTTFRYNNFVKVYNVELSDFDLNEYIKYLTSIDYDFKFADDMPSEFAQSWNCLMESKFNSEDHY